MNTFYAVKFRGSDGQPDVLALDTFGTQSLQTDPRTMSLRGLLTAEVRDRQGDVVLVDGMVLDSHARNPVVLIDHGKHYPLPIGKCSDPDEQYTVEAYPDTGEIWYTAYLSQRSQMAEQVFALADEGILRGSSPGFRPIEVEDLPEDPELGFFASRGANGERRPAGKLVRRSELCEISICGVPVNPEAADLAVHKSWGGRPLAPALAESFRPWLPARKSWATGGWSPPSAHEEAVEAGRLAHKAWEYLGHPDTVESALWEARKAWSHTWTTMDLLEKARVARKDGETWTTASGNKYTKQGGKIRKVYEGKKKKGSKDDAKEEEAGPKQDVPEGFEGLTDVKLADEDHEAFDREAATIARMDEGPEKDAAAADWKARLQDALRAVKDGQQGDKEAPAEEAPAEKPQPEKKPKGTPRGGKGDPAQVKAQAEALARGEGDEAALVEALGSLTVKQIDGLIKEMGAKAGGNKMAKAEALAKQLAERAGASVDEAPQDALIAGDLDEQGQRRLEGERSRRMMQTAQSEIAAERGNQPAKQTDADRLRAELAKRRAGQTKPAVKPKKKPAAKPAPPQDAPPVPSNTEMKRQGIERMRKDRRRGTGSVFGPEGDFTVAELAGEGTPAEKIQRLDDVSLHPDMVGPDIHDYITSLAASMSDREVAQVAKKIIANDRKDKKQNIQAIIKKITEARPGYLRGLE